MRIFLLRRSAIFLLTLLAASGAIFVVMDVLPGNAALNLLGPEATPETIAALTDKLGLNQPAWLRYWSWIAGLAQGEAGMSAAYQVPASELIGKSLGVSIPLAAFAIFLSLAISLPLGIWSAAQRGRLADRTIMAASQIGLAVPSFWAAILLVLVFAVWLRWLPSGGFPGWQAGFWPAIRALILPVVSLALVQGAILTRMTRAAVLDVMGQDFVRTARAKGLSWPQVMRHHVLRNALVPIVTLAGLQAANLLAGTIVVENVFSFPGLGGLMFRSIANRDTLVVRDGVLLLTFAVIMINFAVDLACAMIDPRLRVRRPS